MKRVVIVGYPLGHSLSPVMHNAALTELGLDDEFKYEAMPLSSNELRGFVESVRRREIEGASITIPHKTKVMTYLSTISSEGLAVGAVNTLHRKDGLVIGSNTDIQGFTEAIRENGLDPQGINAVILGAGGAARSVAYGLTEAGVARLGIFNRTVDAANRLASVMPRGRLLKVRSGAKPTKDDLEHSDLLVNCTPVGMAGYSPEESPIESSLLSSSVVVMDLVYNPLRTKLLMEADEAGCKTIDGVGMLVHQGAIAFQLWTGKKAPVEVMKDTVLRALVGNDR
ncbi:MAG: shikimate dehydrogenase [Candidatus Thorarchaeota archaeon]